MHIIHAIKHRYRDQHHSRRYHSMLITQIGRKVIGPVYERLVYKHQCIYLIACPAHHRIMIYIQKKTLIQQIQSKLLMYDVHIPIKDIKFG